MLSQTYCCHQCDGTQLQITDVLHKKRCNTQGGNLINYKGMKAIRCVKA